MLRSDRSCQSVSGFHREGLRRARKPQGPRLRGCVLQGEGPARPAAEWSGAAGTASARAGAGAGPRWLRAREAAAARAVTVAAVAAVAVVAAVAAAVAVRRDVQLAGEAGRRAGARRRHRRGADRDRRAAGSLPPQAAAAGGALPLP